MDRAAYDEMKRVNQPVAFELNVAAYLLDLRPYLWLVAAFAAIGAGAGFVGTKLLDKQWESKAVVSVGHIVVNEQSTSQLIEPLPQIVKRMQLPSYKERIIKASKIEPNPSDPQRIAILKKTFDAQKISDPNLLEVVVRGLSPNDAEEWLKAAVSLLMDDHREISSKYMTYLEKRIDKLESQLAKAEQRLSLFSTLEPKVRDQSQKLEIIRRAISLEEFISPLELMKIDLEGQRSEWQMSKTSLLGNAIVPAELVGPRTELYVLLSTVSGALAGFITACVLHFFRKKN